MSRFYLHDYGLINALGCDKQSISRNWQLGLSPGMSVTEDFFKDHPSMIGQVLNELPAISPSLADHDCRNNQLLLQASQQVQAELEKLISLYGQNRIAIVLGTSTSGIANTEIALKHYLHTGEHPDFYHFSQQDIGSGAEFLRLQLKLSGPAITVSTACSSSGNAFATARRLIDAGFCDAAIVGGADSLCQLTVQGFSSLNSVSPDRCQPFSQNRKGINIGEGAALFLLSREPAELELYGVGCSSDAHHTSAPEPSGKGAVAAIKKALAQGGLKPEAIDYINLHGTATPLNDAMESHAIHQLFGHDVLCSSSKSLTGHTLGAAAATELGLCALLLDQRIQLDRVPAQAWDQQYDADLKPIKIVSEQNNHQKIQLCMSNSFAFGGNNTSLIIGKNHESR